MTYEGEELTHPISGDRLRYLEVSGEEFRVEQFRMPGKFSLESHYHKEQTEGFEVLAGKARYIANGKEGTLVAGESISFPPGTPHVNPWNDGTEELHIIQSMRPAMDFAVVHKTLIVGAGRGYVRPDGRTKLLAMAVVMGQAKGKTYSASLPEWLQRVAIAVLGPIGRLMGYRYEL